LKQAAQPPEKKFMTDRRVAAGEAQEDQFTGMLESQSGKIPSSLFLGAAVVSIFGSAAFKDTKRQGTVCWSVGCAVPHLRDLQQYGETARFRFKKLS
jgi:hypothetical protein